MNKKDWEKIEELLNHETDNVREGAAKALSQAAKHQADITPAIPGLVHALSDKNSSVRYDDARVLKTAAEERIDISRRFLI